MYVVVIWHPFTVLFMVFNFKNDLLLIKIWIYLNKIACENKLINFRYLKGILIVKNFLKQ